VLRDIKRKRRLTHRRARGDKYQIGRLQPRCLVIEISEPGRHTCYPFLRQIYLLYPVHRIDQNMLYMRELAAVAPLRDIEYTFLG
jgi:hypothetical protein